MVFCHFSNDASKKINDQKIATDSENASDNSRKRQAFTVMKYSLSCSDVVSFMAMLICRHVCKLLKRTNINISNVSITACSVRYEITEIRLLRQIKRRIKGPYRG